MSKPELRARERGTRILVRRHVCFSRAHAFHEACETANQRTLRSATSLAIVLCAAIPLRAHHSGAADFHASLVTIHGTVTRCSCINPHVYLYLDVILPDGSKTPLVCEGSAPNGLLNNGWTKNSLKPGDVVTIEGWRAKDRPDGCKVRKVRLPSRRVLVMGWPGEVSPGAGSP